MKLTKVINCVVLLVIISNALYIVECQQSIVPNNSQNSQPFRVPSSNLQRNKARSWNTESKLEGTYPNTQREYDKDEANTKTNTRNIRVMNVKLIKKRSINLNKLKEYQVSRSRDAILPAQNQYEHQCQRQHNERLTDTPVQELKNKICHMFHTNNITVSFCDKGKTKLDTDFNTLTANNINYLHRIKFITKFKLILNTIDKMKETIKTDTSLRKKRPSEKKLGTLSQLKKRNIDSIAGKELNNDIQIKNYHNKPLLHSPVMSTEPEQNDLLLHAHSEVTNSNSNIKTVGLIDAIRLSPQPKSKHTSTMRSKTFPNINNDNQRYIVRDNQHRTYSQNTFQYITEVSEDNRNSATPATVPCTTHLNYTSYQFSVKNTPPHTTRTPYYPFNTELHQNIYSILLKYQDTLKSDLQEPANTAMLMNITNIIICLLENPRYKNDQCQNITSLQETTTLKFNNKILNETKLHTNKSDSKKNELDVLFADHDSDVNVTQVDSNYSKNIALSESLVNPFTQNPVHNIPYTVKHAGSKEHYIVNENNLIFHEQGRPNELQFDLTTLANNNDIQAKDKAPSRKLIKKKQKVQHSEISHDVLQKTEANLKQILVKYPPRGYKTEPTLSENTSKEYILSKPVPLFENENHAHDWSTEQILDLKYNIISTTESVLVPKVEKHHQNNDIMQILQNKITANQRHREDKDLSKLHRLLNMNDPNSVLSYANNQLENNTNEEALYQQLHIVGDGIKIPLKLERKSDDSLQLSVDVDTLCLDKCNANHNHLKNNSTSPAVALKQVENEKIIFNKTKMTASDQLFEGLVNLNYTELKRMAEEALNYQLTGQDNIKSEQNKDEISNLLKEYDEVYKFLNSFDEKDLQDFILKSKKKEII